ncbi:flagellar biosynthetic protein FliO [Photobacterium sp. OFAV2-7]|uniref:flagellar biosynthetic protein FliO n=1 Tax=Photobacterium sp. OFAV2-7 TaxID=2917748 RepID=UPI001EF6CE36|nr:flagellar biosynthetic protein FliO [Photobacterium sp. OFAV2-7]MCG7588017.1 flagellar biosynthetic protein FliO [Photobacterium sp. OFAV2-7]
MSLLRTIGYTGSVALATASMPVLAAPPADMNIATTLAALTLVVILILFLAWLLKRMKLPGIQGSDGNMKILRQLPVGQRERIVLLQVGEEQMLVGITQQNISLLSKLEQPLSMNEVQSGGEFAGHLTKLLKKNVKK